MENKVILTEEILKRVDSLGLKKINIEKNTSLVKYFLNTNISKIFGKDGFDNDEIDFVVTKGTNAYLMDIKTIFSDQKYGINLSNVGDENTIDFIGNNAGEMISIHVNDDYISNYIVDSEGIFHRYTYYPSTTSFEYVSGKLNGQVTFKGVLTPVNAKIGSKELFEFTRVVPPVVKEPSILKRIVDTFKGEGYINIETSSELCDVAMYADRIFAKLLEEENKIKKENVKLLENKV